MTNKLTLRNVKIDVPESATESDLIEWLEWVFGMRSDIAISNPLVEYELIDVKMTVGSCEINGKEIKL